MMIDKTKIMPKTATFIDCCGVKRIFSFTEETKPGEQASCETGYIVCANEITDKDGYKFTSWAPCFTEAFSRLCSKIEAGLATRYLVLSQDGDLDMTHNKISGIIDHGGLLVDGVMRDWDQIVKLLAANPGSKLDLRLSDPAD